MNQPLLPDTVRRVLVTGGAGFIGGALVRRLLAESRAVVFNLDKLGYASDLTSVGDHARHHLLHVDLVDPESTHTAVIHADPDLVFHLAAESHVDRSITGPEAFLQSNINGTFNLLQAVKRHWSTLGADRKHSFRMLHISTDEVYGTLGIEGRFNEQSNYDPRSPYSASKAASDHLVMAWHHTYDLPVVITNCSNNYGPWQFPEKLIPVAILKALAGQPIPIYGDGMNIRDWLYVEDHVDALLMAATKGLPGESYCVGGAGDHGEPSELTNHQVVDCICSILDRIQPRSGSYSSLITHVQDRPGHDRRYAIDSSKITQHLGWKPRHSFTDGLEQTVIWMLNHLDWCEIVRSRSGYEGERLGQIDA